MSILRKASAAIYRLGLKPVLFRYDPDTIHDVFVDAGEELGRHDITRRLLEGVFGYDGPDLSRVVDGLYYRTPILLSAGFDCNARLGEILPSLGFGGEEIGSVTARPCDGNPLPRMARLPRSNSILVNKGLRNSGVETVIARLKLRNPGPHAFVNGISIARTNDELSAPVDAGIADYVYSLRRLVEEDIGDYYTLNISCPNAFGGEAFTDPRLLERLLAAVGEVPHRRPLYAKLPINLPWEQLETLLRIIDRHGLHGVVIGNLNKRHDALLHPDEVGAEPRGSVSGAPCTDLSTHLIARTRRAFGGRFTIVGVGGILTPQQALEKLVAGADLLQLITGLIFQGPSFVSDICHAIARSPVRKRTVYAMPVEVPAVAVATPRRIRRAQPAVVASKVARKPAVKKKTARKTARR